MGAPEPRDTFKLRVQVTIERYNESYGGGSTGDRLNVNEEQTLELGSFLELAGVLGRFHELGEQLRREQQAIRTLS